MVDERAVPLIVAGATDVGKKRQRNEDSIRWHVPDADGPIADFGTVLLVCDGMGGVGQGDVASQTAVEQFFDIYYDTTFVESDTEKRVQRALEVAHDGVREAAESLGRLYIGTTAAGMVIRNDGNAIAFNLGDSRVYRLRGDTFALISKDQSVNAAQLERGEITPEQAAANRNNNITMFLGHPLEMTPVYVHLRVEPGDIFMICSDGLWDVVPEPQLKEILATQPPEQAVKTYIDRTLRNGAPDNVTVIIASTRSISPKRTWWPFALLGLIALAAAALLIMPSLLNNSASELTQTATDTAAAESPATNTAEPDSSDNQHEPADMPPAASGTSAVLVPLELLPSDTPPPSQTPSDTPPPSATATDTASPTASATPTDTTTPTGTVTRRPTRTATSTSTHTPSPTTSSTAVPTATRTPSPTRTATSTPTDTPTNTGTATNTSTASHTPSHTPSATATASQTPPPTDTATFTATSPATSTPQPTSTNNAAFWVLQGTSTAVLELVSVARLDAPSDELPIEIYEGDIERRFENVTEADPSDPGSLRMLVYLRRGVLTGHRFWWLLEDVQPQFEILNDAGIAVYQTATFAAPRLSSAAKGDAVAVTGISPDGNWYRIRSRRGAGWVPALIIDQGYVRFIGDIDDVPIVAPPPLNQASSEEPTDTPQTPVSGGNDDNGSGNQPPEPPTAIPQQATDIPVQTDAPLPTDVPPTDVPATEIPAATVGAPIEPPVEPTSVSE